MAFVKRVCSAMERIAPLRLAESWDNVGLLLEAFNDAKDSAHQENRVLLTIDITPPVLQEAIDKQVNMIVSYHTPIFRPLRAITLSNPLQNTLLRCSRAGISVYSPHSALDSTAGGINDWLASLIPHAGQQKNVIAPIVVKDDKLNIGAGKIVRLAKPGVSFSDCIASIKSGLGVDHVDVAVPYGSDIKKSVESVAICAGSGGSMLDGVDADLYFTGEMAHHEVLAAIGDGRCVILCGHTNTERGYLKLLAPRLGEELEKEGVPGATIMISEKDAHPLHLS